MPVTKQSLEFIWKVSFVSNSQLQRFVQKTNKMIFTVWPFVSRDVPSVNVAMTLFISHSTKLLHMYHKISILMPKPLSFEKCVVDEFIFGFLVCCLFCFSVKFLSDIFAWHKYWFDPFFLCWYPIAIFSWYGWQKVVTFCDVIHLWDVMYCEQKGIQRRNIALNWICTSRSLWPRSLPFISRLVPYTNMEWVLKFKPSDKKKTYALYILIKVIAMQCSDMSPHPIDCLLKTKLFPKTRHQFAFEIETYDQNYMLRRRFQRN